MIKHRCRPAVGQALVEFALALPLLMLVCLGALQVSLYAHARSVVESSVQEGARLAAEDGRFLEEGSQRARALVAAGLGNSVEPLQLTGSADPELVVLRADTALRPIVPLLLPGGLPIHIQVSIARERFRPGGA
jgi:Flp pilus assembly protein TadG